MTYKIETLTMEQLDLVAGGSFAERLVDVGFFQQLGYNMAKDNLEDVFSANGIRFAHDGYDHANEYKIFANGEWQAHPHWATLGYILARRKYPGFTGKWTDSQYVHSFFKDNFHINNLG